MDEINYIKDKIKEIIITFFHLEITLDDIDDDLMITNGGLNLDSVDLVSFIVELEEQFNISFNDEDLGLDHINGILPLARYIAAKKAEEK